MKSLEWNHGGQSQSGSHLWYHGKILPDDLPAEFNEDASCTLKDCTALSSHSNADSVFSYCNNDIDALSEKLGILLESSKTIPFSDVIPFLGFWWSLSRGMVEIPEEKKGKYKGAIEDWLSHTSHTLNNIQKLYGKLLHASLMVPVGHAYLTGLETMLGTFTANPFASHHPSKDINALLLHITSQARKIQPMPPPKASIYHLLSSSLMSQSQMLFDGLSSTLTVSCPPMSLNSETKVSVSSPTQSQKEIPTNPLIITKWVWPLLVQPVESKPAIACQDSVAARPSTYAPHLTLAPSPLCPHCLAHDHLCLWKPAPLQSPLPCEPNHWPV